MAGGRFLKLIVPLRSLKGAKPAMSDSQSTQSPAVLVSIDIAKLRHDVLIEAPGWRSRKRLVLPNSAVEFRRFSDYLHSLHQPVRIGFEATGNYHRPLAHFLLSEGFHLELIPSLAVARTREAMHNSWDKNDPKDAQVLLHLLRTGVTQRYHDPLVNHTHDFQELSLTYAQVSLEKTRMQHRLLTHYLPLYFPGDRAPLPCISVLVAIGLVACISNACIDHQSR
jgi:hypothetical protein